MRAQLRLAVLLLAVRAASACDWCGCYTPQIETLRKPEMARDFYAGVAEQFTHFGTLQFEGREVGNPPGQYLDSSITQLVVGYNLTSRFALQVNAPFIYRSFKRPEGFAINRGTESGIGDMTLLCKCVAFHKEVGGERGVVFDDAKSEPRIVHEEPYFTASAVLLGGAKFPTGSSARLKEEFSENEIEGAPASGIHGHDLALGSGSFDGVFGGQTTLRYRNFFFEADAQYTLRTEGAHQYEYADDVSWSGGPGFYFVRKPGAVVGVQCACSGEHKGRDTFRGETAEDTGITSVFVGPRVVASFGRVNAEVAADLPLSLDNTALQIVPDFRIRGGFALSF